MDEFEQQLSRQIPRRLPTEWRSEILNAANAARDESIAAEKRIIPPEAKEGILRHLLQFQRILRAALTGRWFVDATPTWRPWAALAAVWMVLFVYDRTSADFSPLDRGDEAYAAALVLAWRNQNLYLEFKETSDSAATTVAPPGAFYTTFSAMDYV